MSDPKKSNGGVAWLELLPATDRWARMAFVSLGGRLRKSSHASSTVQPTSEKQEVPSSASPQTEFGSSTGAQSKSERAMRSEADAQAWRRRRSCGARAAGALAGLLAFGAHAFAQGSLFTSQHDYATGLGPFGCKLARLDADAVLDLAVANYNGASVSVYRGLGDGGFTNLGTRVVGPPSCAPRCVEAADFDGDGILDLATANASDDGVGVLLGLGGFSYEPAVRYAVGDFPVWIQAGHMNGDAHLDLVCASQAGEEASVLLGVGDGTFGAASSYALGAPAEQIRLGDLDGNGTLDLVACSWLDSRWIRLLGNGAGGFGSPSSWSSPTPKGIALGDVDQDGWLDVALCRSQFDSVEVWRGTGTGFALASMHYVGDYPTSLELVDLNQDGQLDILTLDSLSQSLTVLQNTGGKFDFAHTSPFAGGGFAAHLSAGDLDSDGRNDAVTTDYGFNRVRSHLMGEFGSWQRYCTAKVNSLGCTPHIHGRGTPSASNVRPFHIDTYSVISWTNGIYFYSVGTAPQSTPFQGGHLCMPAGGIRRTPLRNAGGQELGEIECFGVLSMDMNAFAAGQLGGAPDPALSTAGVQYLVQAWTRDPQSLPFTSGLSDALHVLVGP